MEKIDIIKEELKQILSEKRYIHSIGVMEMAMELAQIYNIDIETAQIAGLLHDNAKEIPDDKRGAHFACTIHFIKADGEEIAVEGKVFGKIAHEPVGKNGEMTTE